MIKRYPWLLPSAFVLSIIGLIIGIVLRVKNNAQVQECSTVLGRAKVLLSSHAREACTTAKAMWSVGTILAIGCGIIAAIVVVVGIVHYLQQSSRTPV